MRYKTIFTSFFFICLAGWSQNTFEPQLVEKHPDTLFFGGNMVIDEYTWLEDLKNPEVEKWYKSQSNYANSMLDQISGQDLILEEFSKVEKVMSAHLTQVQRLKNGSYYYLQLEPDGRPERAFVKKENEEQGEMLFDPLTYKPETGFHIRSITPSREGTKLALILYPNSGQERGELIILDTKKHEVVGDTLYDIPSQPISWTDENSFFLVRSKGEDVLNREIFIHNLNDPENENLFFFR